MFQEHRTRGISLRSDVASRCPNWAYLEAIFPGHTVYFVIQPGVIQIQPFQVIKPNMTKQEYSKKINAAVFSGRFPLNLQLKACSCL